MKRFLLALMAAAVFATGNAQTSANMKVVAHRGGALIGNENTLSAFESGIRAGAEYIELDVHLTADSVVVVCHDPTLNRTTDRKGRICDLTLEQFKQARALDRETGKATDETLPTLAEALDLIKGRAGVLLEIKKYRKGRYDGIEKKVLELIEERGMHDDVICQSFDDEVIERIHSLDPSVRVEKLIFCTLPFGLCFDGSIRRFSFEKYSWCSSVNVYYKFASSRFIRKCHSAGLEVKVWTVDELKDLNPEVDAVITNRPDLFRTGASVF